jgi:hypothetical protein
VTLAIDTGAVQILAAGAACNNNSQPAVSAYFAEAHPQTAGTTGQRAFATDTRGTIYFNNTGTPVPPGMAGASPLQ